MMVVDRYRESSVGSTEKGSDRGERMGRDYDKFIDRVMGCWIGALR